MPQARRQDEQLRLAHQVQESLLPPARAALPGLEVAARFLPSRQVGGDFYDYFPLQAAARTVGFYLGDVQGKGLEGAFYALLINGVMRGLHKTGARPADLLALLNSRVSLRALPAKYCAFLYATLEPRRRALTFANAGLPFPFLLRGRGVTRLQLTGSPLGMFGSCQFEQATLRLRPRDLLLFTTDGLPDSLRFLRPRGGDGEKQVAKLIAADRRLSVPELADSILGEVDRLLKAHPRQLLHDDVAFLALRVL